MKKILSAIAVTASLATVAPAMALDEINWDMQSTYPGSLTQLGTLGYDMSRSQSMSPLVMSCRIMKASAWSVHASSSASCSSKRLFSCATAA